jgi:DNA polymerase-3 subunit beta
MKLVISRLDLLNLVTKIQTIIPTKPALPVLNNVLIEAIDDQLILSATDLTVSMRGYTSSVKVEEPGAIALPAKKFFQLVREITAPQVEIHTPTAEVAIINAGTSHFKLSGLGKSEFPTLPDFEGGISLLIDNPLLKEMLVRSAFSAARDDNRQVLKGILFQYHEKLATFVGTDGKRLARLFADIEFGEGQTGSCVLPLKAVEEIISLLDVKDQKVKLSLLPDKIGIETGNILLITKLLTGQYPDIDRIIPKKTAAPIALHREELISLLRQISLFTKDQASAVRFSFASGQLHLTAVGTDLGEGKVSMAVNYGGPHLEMAFNPYFFMDILRHSKDEVVDLSIRSSHEPGLITDSSNAHFVLMPMRLES